jgi:hypothetical protein
LRFREAPCVCAKRGWRETLGEIAVFPSAKGQGAPMRKLVFPERRNGKKTYERVNAERMMTGGER